MRDEYLVRFLLVILPIIAVSSVLDLYLGYSPFSWALLVTGLLILLFFRLVRRGMRTTGIDVFFFGSVALLSAGYVGGVALGTEEDFVLPLISVLQFAAIAIYGLYASNGTRLRLLLAAVALFDLIEFALLSDHRAVVLVNRTAVLALHFAAYGFGRFLRSYFDQMHRIAEARGVMNRRLEELFSEARASESERLASFSHDIRSPITGIIGVHDLLSATKLDDEQRRYLSILAKSNRLLLELVESMIDREGSPSEELRGVSALRAFLDDALTPYRENARVQGIALKRQVNGNSLSLPLPWVEAARVVSNLVDNALKYTESGSVEVSIHADKGSGAVLSVQDSGRGMSPERLAAVRTGKAGADAAVPGSHGLGLASVRRIAESVGAELLIDSELGKGTLVRVRFPLPDDAPSGILNGTNT